MGIKISSCMFAAKLLQSCPTLCDPRDGSPPGSPFPAIFQARTLEWLAISLYAILFKILQEYISISIYLYLSIYLSIYISRENQIRFSNQIHRSHQWIQCQMLQQLLIISRIYTINSWENRVIQTSSSSALGPASHSWPVLLHPRQHLRSECRVLGVP